MPFSLFQLPLVPLFRILWFLNHVELLELSFCSRKAKNLVKRSRKFVDKMLSAPDQMITWPKNRLNVIMRWQVSLEGNVVITPDFVASSQITFHGRYPFNARKIEDKAMKRGLQGKFVAVVKEDVAKHFIYLIHYLLELFPSRVNYLEVNRDHMEISAMTVGKDGPSCLVFRLLSADPSSVQQIDSAIRQHYCSKHLCFMLGHVNFVFDKPLSAKLLLKTFGKPWFTGKHLENLDCQKIDLWESRLESKDLNEMLKKWMSGKMPRTKLIELCDNQSKLDAEEVFGGIETLPGAKKRPNTALYYSESEIYENGKDIRNRDGVLATAILKETQWTTSFKLVVWEDPFPNVDQIKACQNAIHGVYKEENELARMIEQIVI